MNRRGRSLHTPLVDLRRICGRGLWGSRLSLIVTILGSIAIIIRTLTDDKISAPPNRWLSKKMDLLDYLQTPSRQVVGRCVADKILQLQAAELGIEGSRLRQVLHTPSTVGKVRGGRTNSRLGSMSPGIDLASLRRMSARVLCGEPAKVIAPASGSPA